mmetsp:Transcript_24078/g.44334  ORF Transcript_24078/g.44334 Transcript_24078/m.44334 type:complete len:156 (-) Transcript_24078:97-564(-)
MIAVLLFFASIAQATFGTGHFLRFTGRHEASSEAPLSPLAVEFQRVLLGTGGASTTSGEFSAQCLDFTRALVVQSSGSEKRVAERMAMICASLNLALDVEICQQFRSTLLASLQKSSAWNLHEMNYPFFCQTMSEAKAKHEADVADMAAPRFVPA